MKLNPQLFIFEIQLSPILSVCSNNYCLLVYLKKMPLAIEADDVTTVSQAGFVDLEVFADFLKPAGMGSRAIRFRPLPPGHGHHEVLAAAAAEIGQVVGVSRRVGRPGPRYKGYGPWTDVFQSPRCSRRAGDMRRWIRRGFCGHLRSPLNTEDSILSSKD